MPKDLFDRLAGIKRPEDFRSLVQLSTDTSEVAPQKDGLHFVSVVEKAPPDTYHEVALRDTLRADLSDASMKRHYRGYLIGQVPILKESILHGFVFLNEKRNNEIEFLTENVDSSEASLDNFKLLSSDIKELSSFQKLERLQEFYELAKKNNPRIAERDQAKLACLLTNCPTTWMRSMGCESQVLKGQCYSVIRALVKVRPQSI